MNKHRNTKTIQQYKDTKQRLKKETSDKDVLNMVVRRGANSCADCSRIREEISSGPVALDGSSLLSSFSMPLAVTVISGIDG
jgi:hypothetical protein